MERHVLFEPRDNKKLSTLYPELKDNQHLVELNTRDLLFCWYLGCEASPLYDMYVDKKKENDAIEEAIKICFKPIDKKRIADIRKKMPKDLEHGIEAFNKYNIALRVRSQRLVAKVLSNWEKAIDVDLDGQEFYEVDKNGEPTGRVDFDARKKYIEMTSTITKNIGDLISQAENGFSTSIVKDEDIKVVEEGVSYLDYLHERN